MEFGYTEDTSIVGTWHIVYALWFEEYMEGNYYKVQNDPFTVTIIDPCDTPISVTASILSDQEYTITDRSLVY